MTESPWATPPCPPARWGTSPGGQGTMPGCPLHPGCPCCCCHAVGDVATAGTLRIPGKFGDVTGGLRDIKEVAKVPWEMPVRSTGWIPKDEFGIPQFCPNEKIVLGSFPGVIWGCNPGLWKLGETSGGSLGWIPEGPASSKRKIKSQEAFLEESGAATWDPGTGVESLGGVSDGFQRKKKSQGVSCGKGTALRTTPASQSLKQRLFFHAQNPLFGRGEC